MSNALGKLCLVVFVIVAFSSCAPAKKKTTDEGETSVAPTDPKPIAQPLPKLNDLQKQQTLEVFFASLRMGNALDQLYTPDKSVTLDAVEQYVLDTLHKYCTIVDNGKNNGNVTDINFSIVGDACPAKNQRISREILVNNPGNLTVTNNGQDNYELLAPEITQVIPLNSVVNAKSGSVKLTMPQKNVIQQILVQRENKSINTIEYGTIPATYSLDLELLRIAIDKGDSIELGAYLQVRGNGISYRYSFANFTAEIKIIFSKTDSGELQETISLNGETMSATKVNPAIDLSKLTINQLASLGFLP